MPPLVSRRALSFLMIAGVAASPIGAAIARPRPPAEEDDDASVLPNLFISPAGQPFRAKPDAPYPVADWFHAADKDGDGRLDRAEFVADAAAFFATLDFNRDGVLSRAEVTFYEQRICPEILGLRQEADADRRMGARLWLAQIHQTEPIDPAGDRPPPEQQRPKGLDESSQGAAPFSLLDEPEPLLAADLDLTGVITRKNFLKLASLHFDSLDQRGAGYLTLAGLPKTKAQVLLGKDRPTRR